MKPIPPIPPIPPMEPLQLSWDAADAMQRAKPKPTNCERCGDPLTDKGECPFCLRERAGIYAAFGLLPDTSWRFNFAAKRHLPVPGVTVEQLRARHAEHDNYIPRWTHAAIDGSRLSCGSAHKDIYAACPAKDDAGWALVALNKDAHDSDRHAEGLWRFAWVLPLVEGMRRAFFGHRPLGHTPHALYAVESEGVRALYWSGDRTYDAGTFALVTDERPSRKKRPVGRMRGGAR